MSMLNDPELLKELLEEMRALEAEMAPVVAELKKNNAQPALFEKFANIIDRIYGAAGTFGFKELASYCGTLKKVCYATAKANAPLANAKVVRLLDAYLQNVSDLIKGVTDPKAAAQVNRTMHLEELKVKKLEEEILKYVKK